MFSQLGQISLGCASKGQNKWGPLITEASLIVISCPSHPSSISCLGSSSSYGFSPPFPLVSSQDMSNCHWSQTELLTSSVRELRPLKYTFCRITQTIARLLWSGNELQKNGLVRFLALRGLSRVGKNMKCCFMKYFCVWRMNSHTEWTVTPLKTDVII